jgi:hypothetical protein
VRCQGDCATEARRSESSRIIGARAQTNQHCVSRKWFSLCSAWLRSTMGGWYLFGSITGAFYHVYLVVKEVLHSADGSFWAILGAAFGVVVSILFQIRHYGQETISDLGKVLLLIARKLKTYGKHITRSANDIPSLFELRLPAQERLQRRAQSTRNLITFGLSIALAALGALSYIGSDARIEEKRTERLRPPVVVSFADRFDALPFPIRGIGGAGDVPDGAKVETSTPPQAEAAAPTPEGRATLSQRPRKSRAMKDPWDFPKF